MPDAVFEHGGTHLVWTDHIFCAVCKSGDSVTGDCEAMTLEEFAKLANRYFVSKGWLVGLDAARKYGRVLCPDCNK